MLSECARSTAVPLSQLLISNARSLEKLRQRHVETHGEHVPFATPQTYAEDYNNLNLYHGKWYDPEVGHSAKLLRIKMKMAPWLWRQFNNALIEHNIRGIAVGSIPFETPESREGPMRRAELIALSYPPRPLIALPSSESVDRIRAILAEAVSPPDAHEPEYGQQIDGLDFIEYKSLKWYQWSKEYLDRLFSALIRVIECDNGDDEDWKSIRWEVYDKVRPSMSRLAYSTLTLTASPHLRSTSRL